MKKLVVFLTVMMLFLQQGNAQFPLARHFWLNPQSYNHTLSPTSDGGYILAAAREERGVGIKNTIAVFKLDRNYNIVAGLPPRIIGFPATGGGFDVNVGFEVNDVVENIIVDDEGNVIGSNYVICGSMYRLGGTGMSMGMVTVVNAGLTPLSIREYPDAGIFYSVYADENYFYVCGNTPPFATGKNGIVLRDNIIPPAAPNPTAYVTSQDWEYHKIKVNNFGRDLVVSGTGFNPNINAFDMGFTAFTIAGGMFAPIGTAANPASQRFATPTINHQLVSSSDSKVVVTNDPNNPQGLILSAAIGLHIGLGVWFYEIYTYLFSNYSTFMSGYITQNTNINSSTVWLEDVNTSPISAIHPNGRIAWVGRTMVTPYYTFYLSMNLSLPLQPNYIFFPSLTFPQLQKVHFNPRDNEFHCGGFDIHTTGNKTTFVVAPERTLSTGSCGMMHNNIGVSPMTQSPSLTPLPITQMTVRVNFNTWHDIPGNFCTTDCNNAPFGYPANSNCGNR